MGEWMHPKADIMQGGGAESQEEAFSQGHVVGCIPDTAITDRGGYQDETE